MFEYSLVMNISLTIVCCHGDHVELLHGLHGNTVVLSTVRDERVGEVTT